MRQTIPIFEFFEPILNNTYSAFVSSFTEPTPYSWYLGGLCRHVTATPCVMFHTVHCYLITYTQIDMVRFRGGQFPVLRIKTALLFQSGVRRPTLLFVRGSSWWDSLGCAREVRSLANPDGTGEYLCFLYWTGRLTSAWRWLVASTVLQGNTWSPTQLNAP